jgi:hypothetical protein
MGALRKSDSLGRLRKRPDGIVACLVFKKMLIGNNLMRGSKSLSSRS